MISKSIQKTLRRRMEEERERLIERIDLPETDGDKGSSGNPNRSDLASDFVRRDRNMALLSIDQQVLEQINQALQRIDDGTYGLCLQCGKPIDPERLQALPYATLCMDCLTTEGVG